MQPFNISLNKFPSAFKLAKLIFKRGQKNNVFLLSLLSKVIEEVNHKQTTIFLSIDFGSNHSSDTFNVRMRIRGKKYLVFGKFGVLCFLETPVFRFALLPYYRREVVS